MLSLLTGCGGWFVTYGGNHGRNEDRRSPLEKAAEAADAVEVKRLLAEGADPNDRAGVFGCPLNAAAFHKGNGEVIRILLAAGANPNGREEEPGQCWPTPLFHAASAGEPENTRVLLDAGASLRSSRCSKPVVGWMKPAIVDLLVQHGLNLQTVDAQGRNELHLALAPPVVPPLEGIEYLVRSGVAVNARDASGKTPLSYWREPRDYEKHWFTYWLIDRLSDDSSTSSQREGRAGITAFLERSGATL